MRKQCCPKLPYKKVTHVIFDLDGTILDSESLIDKVLTEICECGGKEFTPAIQNRTAGALVEDIALLLIKELSVPYTPEEIMDMYKQRTVAKCSNVSFMPGAEELIKHLSKHEVPIAIATSSTEDLMLLKTQNHRKVFDLFHHIVMGGSDPEVKKGKPAPDIYLLCASRFEDSPDPANCLVLEDAPNGVEGALLAGMQVVMIPQAHVPYEIWKKATVRLDSLEFIAPELFGLPPILAPPIVPKISFTMHYEDKSAEEKKPKEGEEKKSKEEEVKSEEKKENGKEGKGVTENMFEKKEFY